MLKIFKNMIIIAFYPIIESINAIVKSFKGMAYSVKSLTTSIKNNENKEKNFNYYKHSKINKILLMVLPFLICACLWKIFNADSWLTTINNSIFLFLFLGSLVLRVKYLIPSGNEE